MSMYVYFFVCALLFFLLKGCSGTRLLKCYTSLTEFMASFATCCFANIAFRELLDHCHELIVCH